LIHAMLSCFEFVFGCYHGELSRVFTIKKRAYKVCLDCGQELEYSWEMMRHLRPNVFEQAFSFLKAMSPFTLPALELAPIPAR
jgi:hypothetical protein